MNTSVATRAPLIRLCFWIRLLRRLLLPPLVLDKMNSLNKAMKQRPAFPPSINLQSLLTMNRSAAAAPLSAHAPSANESKRDKKRREIIEKVEKQHAEKIQSFQQ
jgi:hypothetical protein